MGAAPVKAAPRVEVEWGGSRSLAEVLTTRGDLSLSLIHYVGWDATWDEWVGDRADHWVVQEKRGRKVFSRGVWAAAATINRIRAELAAERSTERFARKKEADSRRRKEAQAQYVEDFHGAVVAFLGFHQGHAEFADLLARAVTDRATPVGSGTVARTKRIPLRRRPEAAVIAWMRHQTTGYDGMAIPRVKGKRREVRRMLAQRSRQLLERYRRGEPVEAGCPLKKALANRNGAADEPER